LQRREATQYILQSTIYNFIKKEFPRLKLLENTSCQSIFIGPNLYSSIVGAMALIGILLSSSLQLLMSSTLSLQKINQNLIKLQIKIEILNPEYKTYPIKSQLHNYIKGNMSFLLMSVEIQLVIVNIYEWIFT